MLIFNVIMIIFFLSIGISYSKRFRKYEKYIFVSLIVHDVTLTSGLVFAFFQTTARLQKIEVASCTISMIMVTWFRSALHIQRKYLHKNIDALNQDSFLKYETHKKVRERFFTIIFFIVLSSVTIFSSPVLRFIADPTIDYNDSSIYMVPFLFKFRDVHSLIEYVSLVTIQGSMIVFNGNGLYSYVIFTCYMLCNLETHIEHINARLIDMLIKNDTSSKNFHKSNQTQTERRRNEDKLSNFDDHQVVRYKNMKAGFEELIRYQQFYHEHLKNFMNYLYWTYVGTLVWILLTLILTMFAISQIPKDIFVLMKKISISVNFVLVFYLQCYIGESVSRLADSLLTSLYYTPWYILPPDIRKNMMIVMIQSQKQFDFKIFGMYTINLSLFTKVVKIIYTISNLLIASQNK
ncbi:uncharacterized protein LOC135836678 [Planococcus citri]|uniref:uncharacterized protein LOC135836678 n=1 Tax=Planococcus citri TaxID=170843 RepID=UPI0031F94304